MPDADKDGPVGPTPEQEAARAARLDYEEWRHWFEIALSGCCSALDPKTPVEHGHFARFVGDLADAAMAEARRRVPAAGRILPTD